MGSVKTRNGLQHQAKGDRETIGLFKYVQTHSDGEHSGNRSCSYMFFNRTRRCFSVTFTFILKEANLTAQRYSRIIEMCPSVYFNPLKCSLF